MFICPVELQNYFFLSKPSYTNIFCAWEQQKFFFNYSKTRFKWPLKKKTKIGFQDVLSLNARQKYCRMLQESILQYFRPSLSYRLSLRSLFCLFLAAAKDRFYCTCRCKKQTIFSRQKNIGRIRVYFHDKSSLMGT